MQSIFERDPPAGKAAPSGDASILARALTEFETRVHHVRQRVSSEDKRGGGVGKALERVAGALGHLRATFDRDGGAGCGTPLAALERAVHEARQAALDENASDIVGLALTDLHADIRALRVQLGHAEVSD